MKFDRNDMDHGKLGLVVVVLAFVHLVFVNGCGSAPSTEGLDATYTATASPGVVAFVARPVNLTVSKQAGDNIRNESVYVTGGPISIPRYLDPQSGASATDGIVELWIGNVFCSYRVGSNAMAPTTGGPDSYGLQLGQSHADCANNSINVPNGTQVTLKFVTGYDMGYTVVVGASLN